MSVAHPDDPTLRIVRTDTDEAIEPAEWKFPYIDIGSGSRTKTHDVIGTDAVTQHLGTKAKSINMRGHCRRAAANFIDDLSESTVVRVRSWRFTGYAIVESAETMTTGEGGGGKPLSERVFDYRIDLTETDAPTN